MSKLVPVLTLILLFVASWPAAGSSRYAPPEALSAEVEQSFSQILDLWREGKFADLYDRSRGGRLTREAFAKKLSTAPLKPACCWQKMQEVTVRMEGDISATIRVKLGFEGNGDTEYKTRSLNLVKEEDVWLVSRADLFSLADAGRQGKTKARRTHRKSNRE